jgi:chromosome segregation protein
MIKQELVNITQTIQNCEKDISAYRREISELERLIAKHEENLIDLQDQYEVFRQDGVSFSEQMEEIKEKLEIQRRDFEVRKERYSSQQEGLFMKKKELVKLDNHVQQIHKVKESYLASLTEAQDLMIRLQEEINKQKAVIENRETEIQIRKKELKKTGEELASLQEKEKRRQTFVQDLRTRINPIEKELSAIEESQHLLEMRIVRMDTEREALLSRWREKFGAEEWDQAEPLLSTAVAREKKRRIEFLSEQIRSLGTVDLDSIKEYVQLRERHDFLLAQANDLKEARDSLQRLLKDTERLMSKGFMDFLVQADESFRRTFIEIFGGGEAELVIGNAEDSFSTGVDIVVKMPGKRMQPLNLLSGGERALTCIAFILALLRLKPTPFCLLDEIDAALDETNLQRFSSFIKGMSGEMQFIVITHRQATIEAGEKIYGVTMPQEGVSSVLSLSFEDARSIAG